jgi:hypothetical protein
MFVRCRRKRFKGIRSSSSALCFVHLISLLFSFFCATKIVVLAQPLAVDGVPSGKSKPVASMHCSKAPAYTTQLVTIYRPSGVPRSCL